MLKLAYLPLSVITSIILARTLGPDGFGQYSFAVAVVTALTIPLAPALLQLITRETAALFYAGELAQISQLARWANRRVVVGSLLTVLMVTIGAVTTSNWNTGGRWTLLLLILPAVPLLGLNAVRLGVLTGLRKVVLGQAPEMLVRPLTLLVAVSVCATGNILTPSTSALSYTLASAVAYIVGLVILNKAFTNDKSEVGSLSQSRSRELTKAWVPFSLLVAANTLNSQIGILMLGWLSTNEQVAAMQIATQVGMVIALPLAIVNLTIGPHVTRYYRAEDWEKIAIINKSSVRFALLATIVPAILVIIWGEIIVELIYGKDYVEIGTKPLVILVLGQLINAVFGPVDTLLTMSGYERDTLTGHIVALIVSALTAVTLIPAYGAVGGAIAIAIGLIVCKGLLAVRVIRRIGIRPGPI